MEISYNWLKNYIQTDLEPNEIAAMLTDIGLEVESVTPYENIKGGLKGLVVGHVIEKTKHPDADRLSITKVDVGGNNILQIICGASNVADGQKVVVALPGTQLFPTQGEPFTIKKTKIRGVESNGMICAEDEIGLGNSHAGIIVLNESAKAGTTLVEYFANTPGSPIVENDYIFTIGLTPNRIDAASHYGVARDLAAAINIRHNKQIKAVLPEVNLSIPQKNCPLQIIIEDTQNCYRYAGICIEGVKVTDSPQWLQNRLKCIGINPINNIVDITNYVLHECGQPLHAFDKDKITNNRIVVRKAKPGNTFITLDGVERKLTGEELMICNANDEMCMAGILGGLNSAIQHNTTNIFLESAWFHPADVRKTAKHHGLNTDASFRFERGADIEMIPYALKRAAQMIIDIAGGTISSDMTDIYPHQINKHSLTFSKQYFYKISGADIPAETLEKIFVNLEINFSKINDDNYHLTIPTYRVDVYRAADVAEEILRLYGYNNVKIPDKLNASLSYSKIPDKLKIKNKIRYALTAIGFYEVINNSLENEAYYKPEEHNQLVRLLNPLSNELTVMRKTMLYGILNNIAYNKNRQQHDLKFFETGKTYAKLPHSYLENEILFIAVCGNKFTENWNNNKQAVDFYYIKGIAEKILAMFGLLSKCLTEKINEKQLNYLYNKQIIASVYEIEEQMCKAFDIKSAVFACEINLEQIYQLYHLHKTVFSGIPKYPEVRRDLSLLLDKQITFEDIKNVSLSAEKKLIKEINLFDVYEGKNLEDGKKSYAVSYILYNNQKTLSDTEIDGCMQKLITALQKELGAKLR
jgi:phenylalanyl-tRNA synthetase beta chain